VKDPDIPRLEQEVVSARAKLAEDLSKFRSRQLYEELAETASEVIVEKVRQSSWTAWQGMVDNVKAKVAENPAATLAIAAGLAWRSYRHPPIATALIGGGLYSLLRTPANRVNRSENIDHVAHAKARLHQQATALAGAVTDGALDIASEIKSGAAGIAETVAEQSAQIADAATDKVQEWATNARETVRNIPDDAPLLGRQADARDNLLLGVAGVAVFAALGFAYQRQKEQGDAWGSRLQRETSPNRPP
jgi:hypothetical protein